MISLLSVFFLCFVKVPLISCYLSLSGAELTTPLTANITLITLNFYPLFSVISPYTTFCYYYSIIIISLLSMSFVVVFL